MKRMSEGKFDDDDRALPAEDKAGAAEVKDGISSSSSSSSSSSRNGGEAKDGEQLSNAELEKLFYAVEFLSGTLLEDIMPQDDPPEDVLEGGPLAAKCWEYTFNILGEFSAACIDAGLSGDDAADAARGAFGWSLRHTEVRTGGSLQLVGRTVGRCVLPALNLCGAEGAAPIGRTDSRSINR